MRTLLFPVGNPTLSWIMRVQIALDTARGLEYIHEHTTPHYVHRDVKTSNILLDSAFKAKVLSLNCIFFFFFLLFIHLIDLGLNRSQTLGWQNLLEEVMRMKLQ